MNAVFSNPSMALRPEAWDWSEKGRPVLVCNRKSKGFKEEEHTLKKGQLERTGNNLGHPKRLLLVSEPHHKREKLATPSLCPTQESPYS